MADNLLYKIPESQLGAFEEALEAGEAEIREAAGDERRMAIATGKLRGILRHAPAIADVLRRLWDSTLDMIRSGLIDDYNETRDKLTTAFDQGAAILNGMERLSQTFEAIGANMRTDSFRNAIRDVEQLRISVMENWPRFTEQDLADAKAAYAAGECEELADAFADCAGMDRQTFLQNAEERRRTNKS